ncbi:MAG: S8 family serine peptidase [Bacteroidota bacterium]
MTKICFALGSALFAFMLYPILTLAQAPKQTVPENWWHKDLEKDSIPGIGLERTYAELIGDAEGKPVVVAVLDTKIDIAHLDFKGMFWSNSDEIDTNGLDDDNNGFVDDIHGWNFLGNPQGDEVPYQLAEIVRVIRRFKETYGDEVEKAPKTILQTYLKAQKELEEERKSYQDYIVYLDSAAQQYARNKQAIMTLLQEKPYHVSALDSLRNGGHLSEKEVAWMKKMIARSVEESGFTKEIAESEKVLNTVLDLSFNDRTNIAGGNPSLSNNNLPFQHATPVAGIIAAKRDNNNGIDGFSNQIRIMPVVMVSYGDEHDEDVAQAIRYAVANGADIINMSWGKYYTTRPELVREAMAYAAENDVLLVTGSGNDAIDIDLIPAFPTDQYPKTKKLNNLIVVGGTTSNMGQELVSWYSNYGQQQVDLMAPASKITTLNTNNRTKTGSGTSYASPMVAGTAALLKSHFPDLTAVQLKDVILSAVTQLDLEVQRPSEDDDVTLVPFSSLSNSGGLLNVYEAFILAKSLSKNK